MTTSVRKVPLKYLATKIGSGKTPRGGAEVYVSSGVMLLRSQNIHFDGLRLDDVVYVEESVDEEMASTRVLSGDVLLNITGASIGRCTVVPASFDAANVNQHVCIIRPDPARLDARYLNIVLQSHEIQIAIRSNENGSSREGLNFEQVGLFEIPMRSLAEQRLLAEKASYEIDGLETLIAGKRHLLELLTEKRRALMTYAVTCGLNPDARLRDSGIPWLGEVPAHWNITRLKFLAEVRGGLTLGKQYGASKLIEYPYLRVANVQDGYLDLTSVTTVMIPAAEALNNSLRYGDVLMNEGGDIDKLGRGCVWRDEIENCLHQNHVFCVRPAAVSAEWLDLWTATETAKQYFFTRAKRSTNLASISGTNIGELPVPLPPEAEQGEIQLYLSGETKKIDELIESTKSTTTLLQERRSALIAAAVTGQLERAASAPCRETELTA